MFCLIDINLIANYVQGICNFYKVTNPYAKFNKECFGRTVLDYLKLPKSDFYGSQNYDFWVKLQPVHDIKQIFSTVEKYYNNEIYLLGNQVVTTGYLEGIQNWTAKNLTKYYSKLLFGRDKKVFAGGNLLLTDNEKDCDEFIKYGGIAFLYPRLWNSKFEDVNQSIEKLDEFLEHL